MAFEVCTALQHCGVVALLTGGGAAALYAPQAIQSFDLDFIVTLHPRQGTPEQVLEGLDFRRRGQDYIHSLSRFQLEFPPGPLAVGDELIHSWDSLAEGRCVLHVIHPMDSCRDRLAAFCHFRDRSALEQAVAVYRAQRRGIHLALLQAWSEKEGRAGGYREFLARVSSMG